MGAIVLQTRDGAHLGFMLLAGAQEPLAVGAWTVDCVFQALPASPALFADKAFGCLAQHRDLGEHKLSGEGDGSGARLRAVKGSKALYVHLDGAGLGEWGIEWDGTPLPLGRAFVLPARTPGTRSPSGSSA
jgi:hypothetical protein